MPGGHNRFGENVVYLCPTILVPKFQLGERVSQTETVVVRVVLSVTAKWGLLTPNKTRFQVSTWRTGFS